MMLIQKLLRTNRTLYLLILFFFSISFLLDSCSKNILTNQFSEEELWLHKLTSNELMGRKTGTEGAKETADFIVNELLRMGYSPNINVFSYRDSITMRNIIVEISGKIDSIIIIGAHYDGAVSAPKYQAANDNASGVIALLSIAKSLQPNENNILLCFWDGEENTSGSSFNGSYFFTKHFERLDHIKWYCNIDCCGREGDPIYLYYSKDMAGNIEDNSYLLSKSSIKIIKKLQENSGSDYVPFRNKGIPIWGWNDYDVNRYIHTPDDSSNSISINKIKTVSNITLKLLGTI